MKSTKMILKNLLKEESGQDLIEYGLIAALIALAAVTIMGTIGNSLKSVFTDINSNL
jgi:pilus assembly protein Flp/PilA